MKTVTFGFLFGAACACACAEIAGPDGARLAGWPTRLEVPGGVVTPVSRATAETAGYHEPTPEELAAWAEVDAAAAAEAEAQATLPTTFPTGIAVTNAAGHWVEFIPDGTNVVAETLAIQISESPLDPETRNRLRAAAMAERATKKEAAKTAKAKGNGVHALAERIAALEDLLEVE